MYLTCISRASAQVIFEATYDTLQTLPTYPAPVSAPSMSCIAIVDTVTDPGTTGVGTDGAPDGDAPSLWFQLSWDGEPHLPCISAASHPHLGCISAGTHAGLAAHPVDGLLITH